MSVNNLWAFLYIPGLRDAGRKIKKESCKMLKISYVNAEKVPIKRNWYYHPKPFSEVI